MELDGRENITILYFLNQKSSVRNSTILAAK